MPLVRSTLARCGHTPVLRHRARHRDKVSVAAALTLSPARGHIGLYYQTFPDAHVDAGLYTFFMRRVLRQVRGPVVLVHDGGTMHKGSMLRTLAEDFPRLDLDPLPPYAPELNPVEPLWGTRRTRSWRTSCRWTCRTWTPRSAAALMPRVRTNAASGHSSRPPSCRGMD
jgi:hypothetical protein